MVADEWLMMTIILGKIEDSGGLELVLGASQWCFELSDLTVLVVSPRWRLWTGPEHQGQC